MNSLIINWADIEMNWMGTFKSIHIWGVKYELMNARNCGTAQLISHIVLYCLFNYYPDKIRIMLNTLWLSLNSNANSFDTFTKSLGFLPCSNIYICKRFQNS